MRIVIGPILTVYTHSSQVDYGAYQLLNFYSSILLLDSRQLIINQ